MPFVSAVHLPNPQAKLDGQFARNASRAAMAAS